MKKWVHATEEVNNIADEVTEKLKEKYNVMHALRADELGFARGGNVIYLSEDEDPIEENIYRIFIDTRNNELIFQVIMYGFVSPDGEVAGYSDVSDFYDCKIDGMSADEIFEIICDWIDKTEPNFTEWSRGE